MNCDFWRETLSFFRKNTQVKRLVVMNDAVDTGRDAFRNALYDCVACREDAIYQCFNVIYVIKRVIHDAFLSVGAFMYYALVAHYPFSKGREGVIHEGTYR